MKTQIAGSVLLAGLFLAPSAVLGQSILTRSYDQVIGAPTGNVPDGSSSLTFSQVVAGSGIDVLTRVEISLHLSGTSPGGGWAGDLFVSLNKNLGAETAVLLNQVGVSGSDPVGHGYDGWNVVFRDDAVNGDVHGALPGPGTLLTGQWQPDGRLSPTSNDRTAMLQVFNGAQGDGTWHLTLADLSPGGAMTVHGWTLSLTGTGPTPVPEPGEWAALTGLALAGFAVWRRRSR